MVAQDGPFALAGRAGKTHGVGQHHLARACARQANQEREFEQCQVDRRQQHVLEAVGCEKTPLDAHHHHGFTAPSRRQHAQVDREGEDQHQPDPERGHGETQHRDRHDGFGGNAVRRVARVHAQRHAQQRRTHDGGQCDLQRSGQARQNQLKHRHVVDERAAKVAAGQLGQEGGVLVPQGFVKTIGTNRLFADLLRDIGRDHHVDRVADRIDTDKHHHRDDEHHHRSLQQALDDECQHGS